MLLRRAFRSAPPAGEASSLARHRWLAQLALLSALALAGRMAFLWAPNVALTYFVVFLAGLCYGGRMGASVGLLSMTLSNLLLSGLHPVLLVTGPAMALLGVAGAATARAVNLGQRADLLRRWPAAVLAGSIGALATFLFSASADLGDYALFHLLPANAPEGGVLLSAYLLRGLVFNLPAAAVNAVVFGSLTTPLARALRRAGLLDPAPPPRASGPLRGAAGAGPEGAPLRPPPAQPFSSRGP